MDAPVPFTLLTGFLGAGKTTALNRLIAAGVAGDRRVAVLINELGRVAIDAELIVGHGGDLLELAGGCVCCQVGDDLWDGVADVVKRSAPDHLVLETTGVAEPAALVAGLAALPERLAGRIALAGVICVVDGRAGADQLDAHEVAREQVAAADRVLLSKLDVATPAQLAAVHARLDAVAPAAERAAFPAGEDPALAAWVLEVRGGGGGTPAGHPPGHRHRQLAAVSYAGDVPLLAAPLRAVLQRLAGQLVRVKGWVDLADGGIHWLELAGGELGLEPRPRAGGGSPTELVLIGEEVDEAALRRQLDACRAGDRRS